MTFDTERSEAVVEGYKNHKLASSALRRIQEIIHGFERDRAADLRMARIGIFIIITILGVATWFFLGVDSQTLS
jgi:hypothetical protein